MQITQITFPDFTSAQEFFSSLDYRALPVRGATVLASHGYNDGSAAIITFAHQHLSDRLTYTLTEVPRRPRR